jgi:acyl dehydratase
MADATITSVEELKQHVGKETRVGDWHTVTQEEINQFADATGDHQWIHVDQERAKAGPFGGTIAHGYLTLSMVIPLFAELLEVTGVSMGINYGLNKVRFPAPVPVGAKIRLAGAIAAVEPVGAHGPADRTAVVGKVAAGGLPEVFRRYG